MAEIIRRTVLAAVLGAAGAVPLPAQFGTLYNFAANSLPGGRLIQANDGNFYGVTLDTAFKLTPSGTFTPLGGSGFAAPLTSGLMQASDGNFYGVTSGGGTNANKGTAFKLTPSGAVTTIYNFGASAMDGWAPVGPLVQASDGNLYGTTSFGGANNNGVVYRMTTAGIVTIIHNFNVTVDGGVPVAGLIVAADGSLYGTTSNVLNAGGTIFRITLGGTFTTVYTFPSSYRATGGDATIEIMQASDGNLYGTTAYGGVNGSGTVFRLTPAGALTTLHFFNVQTDALEPVGAVVQGSDGNFYGETAIGGVGGLGILYEVTPCGGLTVLHSFTGTGGDGAGPRGGLIKAANGIFYGMTIAGGTNPTGGTVFSYVLPTITGPSIAACNGVVSAASFQPGISAYSWVTINGTNLASTTDTWAKAIVNGNLPTMLDGVSVSIGGLAAYVYYVSPTQLNVLAPGVADGAVAVTVTNSLGTSAAVSATVQNVTPAFFQWGSYTVATRPDFSLAVKNGTFTGVTTVPAKPGDVIILWGTGFGPTTPAAPPGVEVPSDTSYATASPVAVTVGGATATVYGAALTPGNVGLYQVAIQIPTSLTNGDYPVLATIGKVSSPAGVLITVQQ